MITGIDNMFAISLHALLALVGGMARELSCITKNFNWTMFIGGAFVSLFAGIVMYFLCMNYQVAPWLTAAATSLAGYIGAPLLD
jgi:hypothetical protein